MNIVDTNGIDHILKNNLSLHEDCYLAPDVVEEVELTQTVHGKRISGRIIDISKTGYFNEITYLDYYNQILNKYGGRSFYNMTGFGDVSILATLHMLLDYFDQEKQGRLFDVSESIIVFTNDGPLITKINTEFPTGNITIQPANNIP